MILQSIEWNRIKKSLKYLKTKNLFTSLDSRKSYVMKKALNFNINLINDVSNRTESACPQELTYLSMELAIKAQEQAEKK